MIGLFMDMHSLSDRFGTDRLQIEGGGHQRLRIVLFRCSDHLVGRALLDHLAGAHDDDVIGRVRGPLSGRG